MTTSAIFTRQQIHSFTHFFPKECRNNATTKLFIAALLPHLSQFQNESIFLTHCVPHHLLDSVLDQFYPNHVARILYKIRELKEKLQTATYRKCLLATQTYFRSRDFSIPGKHENKLPTSCVQYFGEAARFQNLNKGLDALLNEVKPTQLSWSQSIRSRWDGFLDYCSSSVTSATSYLYNNPGKAACGLLALEAAALTMRSHMHHTTLLHEFTTQLSCTPNLMLGILTQNPIYITAAGISCLPVASSQIVNGQIPDQLLNVGDLFSMQINMTELFGEPVSNVMISQSDGTALPDWLAAGQIAGSLSTIQASGVVVNDNLVYVADGIGGLKIIDVSKSSNPFLRGSLPTTRARGIVVNGNLAYVADYDGGLKIIDVSKSSNPFLRGSLSTTRAQGVIVNGNLAYVADNDNLKIVNVSDANHPILKSSIFITYASGVAISGSFAYVTGWRQFIIIDISNSTHPILKGALYIQNGNNGIIVNDNLAYITGDGLEVIDVSNSSHPILKSSLPTTSANGITVNGNFAYVADGPGGLKIVDVSNSSHPILKNSISTTSAYGVAVKGNCAYIADGPSGLKIINLDFWKIEGVPLTSKQKYHLSIRAINDLSKVVKKDFFISTDSFPTSINSIMTQSVVPGASRTLHLNVNNLFQDKDVDDTLSLRIQSQNAALPEFMQFKMKALMRGSLSTTTFASKVTVNGNFAYVANGADGFKIIDISNYINPFLRSNLSTTNAQEVAIKGNTAYLADRDGGLRIIDVSDSAKPLLKGSLSTTNALGVTVNGNFSYVADGWGGLKIIDVSDSAKPLLKGSLRTPTIAEGVAINGNLAYVADALDGLKIIDVSNSTHPILLGGLRTTHARGVAINGAFAYVADSSGGLRIIDVSNSIKPLLRSSLSTNDAISVVVDSNLAYVADTNSLKIIDVSNSTHPIVLRTLQTAAAGVAVNGEAAYVVGGTSLKIIDLTNYQLTATPTHEDEGNYLLTVSATDPWLATADSTFILRVESAPRLMQPLPSLIALIGQPFNCFVPEGTFWDPNNDLITYSVKSLPSFLTFNPTSSAFWGIPGELDRGEYNISILATDRILPPTPTMWNLLVHSAPALSKLIPDQAADIGKPFIFTLDPHTFEDKDDHYVLTYSAEQDNQMPLPQWLHFLNQTQTFIGTPQETDKGEITIAVKVDDSLQGAVKGMFHLLVEHFPRSAKNFSSIFAATGHSFSFNAPSYFTDIDGEPLRFAANSNGALLPKNLNFDSNDCRFTSTFQATDKGIIPITLIASDPNGGFVADKFNITVVDYITALAASNPPEVVIENRPPALVEPLMEQSFSADVKKEFSIKSAFKDLDGDPLTFNADLGDASWLSLDPISGVFSGTPSSRDAATYATRRYTIGVTAMDPANKTAAGSFEILLQGPSSTEKVINALMWISGFAVATWGYYQKKYLLWNWCRKSKYQQPPLYLVKGKTDMVYQIGHPLKEIKSISITTIRDGRCFKRRRFCLNMCKNTKERIFQGGAKAYLFDWLFYEPKTNQLHVIDTVPENLQQEDIEIRIIGTDNRIMEQVNIQLREENNEVADALPNAPFAVQLRETQHQVVSSSVLSAPSALALFSDSATSRNAQPTNYKTPLLESKES